MDNYDDDFNEDESYEQFEEYIKSLKLRLSIMLNIPIDQIDVFKVDPDNKSKVPLETIPLNGKMEYEDMLEIIKEQTFEEFKHLIDFNCTINIEEDDIKYAEDVLLDMYKDLGDNFAHQGYILRKLAELKKIEYQRTITAPDTLSCSENCNVEDQTGFEPVT